MRIKRPLICISTAVGLKKNICLKNTIVGTTIIITITICGRFNATNILYIIIYSATISIRFQLFCSSLKLYNSTVHNIMNIHVITI